MPRKWQKPVFILQSWIHWSRQRRPFYNKIGEVGGWKNVGGNSGKQGRLIPTQYFYFSDKNDFKKLSAAPFGWTVGVWCGIVIGGGIGTGGIENNQFSG